MLPLNLLNAAVGKAMMVELKNSVVNNGHLKSVDGFMNITLTELYETNAKGDEFMRLKEIYIKGSLIKTIRIPEELLDQALEEQKAYRESNKGPDRGGKVGGRGRGSDRGGRGGRGGGGNSRRGAERGGRGPERGRGTGGRGGA